LPTFQELSLFPSSGLDDGGSGGGGGGGDDDDDDDNSLRRFANDWDYCQVPSLEMKHGPYERWARED
jgi:hypothetical protein